MCKHFSNKGFGFAVFSLFCVFIWTYITLLLWQVGCRLGDWRIMFYFEHIEWFVSSLLHPDLSWSTQSAIQWIQRAYSSWCISGLLIVICCWGEWRYVSSPHTYLHILLLDLIKLGGNYRDHLLQYHEPRHFGTWCVYVCFHIITTINTGFSEQHHLVLIMDSDAVLCELELNFYVRFR